MLTKKRTKERLVAAAPAILLSFFLQLLNVSTAYKRNMSQVRRIALYFDNIDYQDIVKSMNLCRMPMT